MFIRTTPKKVGGIDGCYCALVESVWKKGTSSHKVICSLGFFPYDHIPYLKAAFSQGEDPALVLEREKERLARRSSKGVEDATEGN